MNARALTEEQWRTAVGPTNLLLYLRRVRSVPKSPDGRRRLRLFGVACVRRVLAALTDADRQGLEAVERLAEAGAAATDFRPAWPRPDVSGADYALVRWAAYVALTEPQAWQAAALWRRTCMPDLTRVRGTTPDDERKVQADLVRCLFGNPFRPYQLRVGWRTPTAVGLATAIHEERAFDRLPVLADALEEAGCDDADLLAHCRHGKHHARGCRAVDTVLGRV